MDITQMNYFITIVECGCNLSLAAKRIHISQSALSQFITNFERDEEIELFVRSNGRLEELTPSGKKVYAYALKIVKMHEEMQETVRKESAKQKERYVSVCHHLFLLCCFLISFHALSSKIQMSNRDH